MSDSIVSANELARARLASSSLDLLQQNGLDALQMRSHDLLCTFGILALDCLKYFPMVLQHSETAVGYAFDASLEHEFFASVVQHASNRAVAGDLGDDHMKILVENVAVDQRTIGDDRAP